MPVDWEDLARRVEEKDRKDHLDPVRDVVSVGAGLRQVEREILEEVAGALGRAEEKVERAIEVARELAAKAVRDASLAERFEEARRAALAARRDLLIHREALRFPSDPDFERRYPVPPPLRLLHKT